VAILLYLGIPGRGSRSMVEASMAETENYLLSPFGEHINS